MNEAELVNRLSTIKKALKIPSWYRQSLLIARFHSLCQKKYGKAIKTRGKSGWSLRDTAGALQISLHAVQDSVDVMKLVKGCPDYKTFSSRDEVFRAAQLKEGK